MSIYPGGRDPSAIGTYSLIDAALANSMAGAMEDEMEALFQAVKGHSVPATGREDRRLLFVAIARGVLKYLQQHETGNMLAQRDGGHTHPVHLNITLDKFQ